MSTRDGKGGAFLAAALVVLLVGIVPAWVPSVQAAPPRSPHAPIFIAGDADLCDDEDGDGTVGQDDGIVNCGTADGTPLRPYVIESLSIAFLEENLCLDGFLYAPGSGCEAPRLCPDSPVVAAVMVCQTTKHIELRDLAVSAGAQIVAKCPSSTAVSQALCEPEDAGDDGATVEYALLSLFAATNVTVSGLELESMPGAIRVAGGPLGDSNTRPPGNIRLAGLRIRAPPPESVAAASLEPVVSIEDSDVAIEDSVIEARGKMDAVSVDNSKDGGLGVAHAFAMERSTVRNATRFALLVYESDARIVGNAFSSIGVGATVSRVPGLEEPSGVGYATVQLESTAMQTTYDISENEFSVPALQGTAMRLAAEGGGVVERNRFFQDWAGGFAIDLTQDAGCGAKVAFNDLNDLSVLNRDRSCYVDARHNWWGRPEGPTEGATDQATGRIVFDPWLRFPLAKLPLVAVASPASGSEAYAGVELLGTATTHEENPLLRVEATRSRDDWSTARLAEGLESWRLSWDLDGEPLGPLTLWLRACGEVECGASVEFTVVHVETPVPPVALLEAAPRVAHVRETVRLDASGSYSPQGRAIQAYRFDLGDGRRSEWGPNATLDVAYAQPRTYSVSVEVRDGANLTNTNVANVVLRVLGEGERLDATSSRNGGSVPGLGVPLAVAAALAAAMALARRRTP